MVLKTEPGVKSDLPLVLDLTRDRFLPVLTGY